MKAIVTTAIAVVGLAALAGCYATTRGEPARDSVTANDASIALEDLYTARGDSNALCALGASSGNCRVLLQDAGTAPESRPVIVCSLAYAGDSTHASGLVVRIHTEGRSIDTESLVLSLDGEVRYMNPVYWNGARFSEEGVSEPTADYACR